MKKGSFSIRYKFLLILAGTCFGVLSLFLTLAAYLFKSDKQAYVFDTSQSQTRSLADSLRGELDTLIETTRTLSQTIDLSTGEMTPAGTFLFDEKRNLVRFEILTQQSGSSFTPLISREKRPASWDDSHRARLQGVTDPISVHVVNLKEQLVAVAMQGRRAETQETLWSVALFELQELRKYNQSQSAGSIFVADQKSGHLFGESLHIDAETKKGLVQWVRTLQVPESTRILTGEGDRLLVSTSEVGLGNLYVLSAMRESIAFAALRNFLENSVIFSVMIFSLVFLISWISSNQVTSPLRHLSSATDEIARGNFNVQIKVKSKDEVGTLTDSFNLMAAEVARLMSETAEKARMEAELQTAHTVQNTLFPPKMATWPGFQVYGHHQAASECGGDWWYYHENNGRIFVWVGDATGHGAPAALITSAARAAASIIEWQPNITPGQALRIMNRAIHATSKGEMMMTFFLGCFDTTQGTLTYSNASHNPPLMLKGQRDGEVTRKDYQPLIEVNNPRLGQNADQDFKEATLQLSEGDQFVFYSDGVVELKNREGKELGERRFLKSLSTAFNSGESLEERHKITLRAIEDFREEEPLQDDVTLVFCEFKGAVVKRAAA